MGWNWDEEKEEKIGKDPTEKQAAKGFEIEHDIEQLKKRQDHIRESLAEILRPMKTFKTQVDDSRTLRSY